MISTLESYEGEFKSGQIQTKFQGTFLDNFKISTSYAMLKLRTKRIPCKLISPHLMKRTFMIITSDQRSKLLSVKIRNLKGMKTIS